MGFQAVQGLKVCALLAAATSGSQHRPHKADAAIVRCHNLQHASIACDDSDGNMNLVKSMKLAREPPGPGAVQPTSDPHVAPDGVYCSIGYAYLADVPEASSIRA